MSLKALWEPLNLMRPAAKCLGSTHCDKQSFQPHNLAEPPRQSKCLKAQWVECPIERAVCDWWVPSAYLLSILTVANWDEQLLQSDCHLKSPHSKQDPPLHLAEVFMGIGRLERILKWWNESHTDRSLWVLQAPYSCSCCCWGPKMATSDCRADLILQQHNMHFTRKIKTATEKAYALSNWKQLKATCSA